MKSFGLLFLCILCVVGLTNADPIIVDHTCCDLAAIPESALQDAKDSLSIIYGHTSHGSQITYGMGGLVDFINGGGLGLSFDTDFFEYNGTGSDGALRLTDYIPGASDLGNPNRTAWATATRDYLDNNSHVNVVMWSWCGQVDGTEEEINTYLNLMNQLEIDYPDVQFVYMTGHLNGTGETGNVNVRNQQIRDYCIANDKILYDFADIESYDPDGLVHYMPLMCSDNCDYDSDGNGSRDTNWATVWQNNHTENVDWYDCYSAHSQALNANRKAYAAWYLWACLAGWQQEPPCLEAPSDLGVVYDDQTGEVTLTWTDNSNDPNNEDWFIVQRQVDSGSWDENYSTALQDAESWSETVVADGTYRYRVLGYIDEPCESAVSNTVTVVIANDPPDSPSNLVTTLNDNSITITWNDNSNNEQNFVLECSVDSGAFVVLDNAIAENVTSYIDSDLTVEHTYAYRVKAVNTYGDSSYSNTDSEYVPLQSYTVRLYSTEEIEDSFLRLANPDTNYGSSSYINPTDYYILKFNLPEELDGKNIISANLGLYIWAVSYDSSDCQLQVNRVDTDWDEGSVTWNSASTGIPWLNPGGDYAETVTTFELQDIDHEYILPEPDIAPVVQRWVLGEVANQGVIVVNDSASSTTYKAVEYSGNHTYLDITYDDSCPYDFVADFDGSCTVDANDLVIISQSWLTDDEAVDVSPEEGDGTVDLNDWAILASEWLLGL